MSRASDITLFLIILQACIGLVDGLAITSTAMAVPDNEAMHYNVTDLSEYQVSTDPGIEDTLLMYADFAWEALIIGIKIIMTVVVVAPTLIGFFNVPTELAVVLQIGIYYIYATWYAQYKSGKGWKAYE